MKQSIKRIGTGLLALSLVTASPNPMSFEPTTVSAATQTKVFNKASTVKAGAYRAAKVLKHVKQGEAATVLQVKGSWTKIQVGNVTGWVAGSDLSDKAATVTKVFNKDTSIQAGAFRAAKVVRSVKQGEAASVLEVKGSWTKVKVGTVQGWVAGSSLSDEMAEAYEAVEEFVLKAGRYQAAPIVANVPAGAKLERVAVHGSWSEVVYNGKRGFVANWIIRKALSEGKRIAPSQMFQSTMAHPFEQGKKPFKFGDIGGVEGLESHVWDGNDFSTSFIIEQFKTEAGRDGAAINALTAHLYDGSVSPAKAKHYQGAVRSYSLDFGEIIYGADTIESVQFAEQMNRLYDEFGVHIKKHLPDDHPEVIGTFLIGSDEFDYNFFNGVLYIYFYQ
ncbi:hypothetical protein EVJ20_07590 [Exiguobacterium sp. SH0S1]|uniref:SH3 domain-containing protein n=1 Tax=Exiguobacterium sp. SH0S1 TaxID=2510949 RepID=UPI00103F8235|nr:hypothetical protein [Exiguobacterium sp. SH0S1]TCI77815.1 hypothetical protein EVJ20_07590 [Exiguobacterium sp. SH0S1]